MDSTFLILSAAATAATATFALPKLYARCCCRGPSIARWPGIRRCRAAMARLIPFYDFGIDAFFDSDGAPPEIDRRRMEAFFRLAQDCKTRFAKSRQMTAEVANGISDLQFVETYRVPFQYSRLVREHLGAGAFVAVVGRRDGDRPRRQRLLRPDRLVRRQHLWQRLL